MPLSRSKGQRSGRRNAPCPVAGARHSLSPHHRSRTGKPTNHRQRTDRSSTGRTPHRPAAQVNLLGTATHDAAHGSRNPASGRPLPPPVRQSWCRRTDTSRATRRRRDIEVRQDRRRCDQRHRDPAERAIQAARGGGYAGSRKVNGIWHPTAKRNRSARLRFVGRAAQQRVGRSARPQVVGESPPRNGECVCILAARALRTRSAAESGLG